MSLTNFAALTNEQKTVWSRDFWAAARNASFINKFAGTGPNSMVQRIPELTKDKKGARAVITLVADLVGDGVAADNTLEGNEEAMKPFDQVIRIDQLRHANQHLGRMADQKSVANLREQSRDKLAYWIGDRMDQIAFLTLTGVSYAFKNTGQARVGSQLPQLEYAADVTAPTATCGGLRQARLWPLATRLRSWPRTPRATRRSSPSRPSRRRTTCVASRARAAKRCSTCS